MTSSGKSAPRAIWWWDRGPARREWRGCRSEIPACHSYLLLLFRLNSRSKRNDPLSVGTVGRFGIFAATCCFLFAAPTLNPQTDTGTHAHGHGTDACPGVSGVKHLGF